MRSRILLTALLTASLGAGIPVMAQEALVIGRVERITLQPLKSPGCPDPCAADGTTRVCITNAGGCEETAFQIEQVLLGDDAPGPRTYRAPIGEWGGHRLPVSAQPILVHVVAGGIHWSALTEHDGKRYFSAAAFKRDTVGGVAVASLVPDENGEVPLDVLVAQVHAPH